MRTKEEQLNQEKQEVSQTRREVTKLYVEVQKEKQLQDMRMG